jgi:hypothetical protein
VPEAGLPPVAVHENVTAPVPPTELAEQLTAVPTVPVDGQVIVTVKDCCGFTVIPRVLEVSPIFETVPSVPTANAEYGEAPLALMYW